MLYITYINANNWPNNLHLRVGMGWAVGFVGRCVGQADLQEMSNNDDIWAELLDTAQSPGTNLTVRPFVTVTSRRLRPIVWRSLFSMKGGTLVIRWFV